MLIRKFFLIFNSKKALFTDECVFFYNDAGSAPIGLTWKPNVDVLKRRQVIEQIESIGGGLVKNVQIVKSF